MLDGRERTSILDVGGRPEYWQMMMEGSDLGDRLDVTLLNVESQAVRHPDFCTVIGDARSMPEFADGKFDIVFSNSTIEHVGSFEDQRRMANEVAAWAGDTIYRRRTVTFHRAARGISTVSILAGRDADLAGGALPHGLAAHVTPTARTRVATWNTFDC